MIVNVYVHSTDMSQAVQLHNHTSLLIRPDQPCDTGESQLSAGSFPSELPPSESVISLLLEQLVKSSMYHVYTLHIHVHTVYIHLCTWVLLIICVYHFHVCLSVQPM